MREHCIKFFLILLTCHNIYKIRIIDFDMAKSYVLRATANTEGGLPGALEEALKAANKKLAGAELEGLGSPTSVSYTATLSEAVDGNGSLSGSALKGLVSKVSGLDGVEITGYEVAHTYPVSGKQLTTLDGKRRSTSGGGGVYRPPSSALLAELL